MISKTTTLELKLGNKYSEYLKAQVEHMETGKKEMKLRDEVRALEKELKEEYKQYCRNVSRETQEG